MPMKMKDYERENADIMRKLQEEDERERIQNPLSAYSSTQLKAELLEENKESPEVLELSMADCVRVLMESGVQDREVEEFEEEFGEQGMPITATNIINPNKLTINTTNAKVVIDSECIDRMETRMIDGGKYLLIPVDDHIEVNDIVVRTFKVEE